MGFEPTNGGFADSPWKRILLVRLAFTPALIADFRPYSAAIVPKLFPAFGVNPIVSQKLWAQSPGKNAVKRKRYSRKFQRMAVARMRTCENVGELARELG